MTMTALLYAILCIAVVVVLPRLISRGADINARKQVEKAFAALDMVVAGTAYRGDASELVYLSVERLGGDHGFNPDNPYLIAKWHKCVLLALQGGQWYAYHVLLWEGHLKEHSVEPLSIDEAKSRVGKLGEGMYRKYFGPHDPTARVVPIKL